MHRAGDVVLKINFFSVVQPNFTTLFQLLQIPLLQNHVGLLKRQNRLIHTALAGFTQAITREGNYVLSPEHLSHSWVGKMVCEQMCLLCHNETILIGGHYQPVVARQWGTCVKSTVEDSGTDVFKWKYRRSQSQLNVLLAFMLSHEVSIVHTEVHIFFRCIINTSKLQLHLNNRTTTDIFEITFYEYCALNISLYINFTTGK